MAHLLRCVLPLAVLSVLTTQAEASVFWRWSTRGQVTKTLEALGGTRAYGAEMRVNGQPSTISIYQLPGVPAETIPQLARAFSATPTGTSASFGQLQHIDNAYALHLLVLNVSEQNPASLVIAINQSRAAYDASRTPTHDAVIPQLPSYPQATCLFNGVNTDTATQLATLRTSDAASDVRRTYRQLLAASGWASALPDPPGHDAPLAIYLKNDELCVFAASRQMDGDATIITLLHKQLDQSKQGAL
jgi:hypothetical protein